MFALFSLSVLFTSLACLELLCLCQKMANAQPNSQSSQLDEEDLNNLEEAVSENNACSSSSKAEKLTSVCRLRAILTRPFRQLCQTANSQIVQLTSTLLNGLFSAGSTEDCIIFPSNILEQKLFFFKYCAVVFCRVCFVNMCNRAVFN